MFSTLPFVNIKAKLQISKAVQASVQTVTKVMTKAFCVTFSPKIVTIASGIVNNLLALLICY